MKLKLLFVIVDRNRAEKVIASLGALGVSYSDVMLGVGTALSALSELLGVGETEKAVIMGTVTEDRLDMIWECLRIEYGFEQRGTGIAFTIPISSVGGPATLMILSGGSGETKEKKYGI